MTHHDQSPKQAPLAPPPVPPVRPTPKKVNHLLHLVLTIITFGSWAIMVWPWWAIAINLSNSRAEREYEQKLAAYTRDYHLYQQGLS
ncbi:hypothetical protein SAMN06265360_10472 [Haloechinothrix alba]|uniref:Uncharacterized protein n=1 Tax=Haloechinothrix alba TaxID=664784 RepID=A0A238VUA1_9PSEU|nr:hypothetical protein SAMN06265360_10472 [Haloechinothrix alba]